MQTNTIQDIHLVNSERTQNLEKLAENQYSQKEYSKISYLDEPLYIQELQLSDNQIDEKQNLKKKFKLITIELCNNLGYKLQKHKLKHLWVGWGSQSQIVSHEYLLNSNCRFNSKNKTHIGKAIYDNTFRPQRWFYFDKKEMEQILINREICRQGSDLFFQIIFKQKLIHERKYDRIQFLKTLLKKYERLDPQDKKEIEITDEEIFQYIRLLNELKNVAIDPQKVKPFIDLHSGKIDQEMGQKLTLLEKKYIQKQLQQYQDSQFWVMPRGAEFCTNLDGDIQVQPDALVPSDTFTLMSDQQMIENSYNVECKINDDKNDQKDNTTLQQFDEKQLIFWLKNIIATFPDYYNKITLQLGPDIPSINKVISYGINEIDINLPKTIAVTGNRDKKQNELINISLQLPSLQVQNYLIFLDQKLGKGQFGEVYLCQHKTEDINQNNDEKQCYAVKIIPLQGYNRRYLQDDSSSLNREIQVLKNLKHPNLVCLREIQESKNNLYMILDFCDGGDLRNYLEKKNKKLSEGEAVEFFKQIVKGYQAVYEQKIIHRDLKPENILLHQGQIKIGDFGFGRFLEDTDKAVQISKKCTPIYASPQMLKSKHYSSKCDIWSLGVILYEIIYGTWPFFAQTEYELVKVIEQKTQGKKLVLPKEPQIDPKLAELIQKMLQYEESDRISWTELFNDPIIINKQDDIQVNLETEEDSDFQNQLTQSIFKNRQSVKQKYVKDVPLAYVSEEKDKNQNKVIQEESEEQKQSQTTMESDSAQYQKTKKTIIKDFNDACEFFPTFKPVVKQELEKELQDMKQNPYHQIHELQVLQELVQFIVQIDQNQKNYNCSLILDMLNKEKIILTKFLFTYMNIEQSDEKVLKALYGLQIFALQEVYQPKEKFMTFDFRKFYNQELAKQNRKYFLEKIKLNIELYFQ
ncbi:Protein kinase-like domain [Pseudocohnilembus persalinus]|uniref:Protein kinase-like domain n=1 Tax=Pseudocohnilembus persalinus TaxID=266149 RepID=A0A0V0QY59_PSEPJ|nr:Protein kinase-like domain [Pseudocohnilembus persalinus]|eukprot:KRX06976.1 Protein kinase-like domain [Pseudocohnilembus persalinus]